MNRRPSPPSISPNRLANGVLILLIQGQKEHLCPAAAEEADNTVAPPTCALLIRRVLVWLPALRYVFIFRRRKTGALIQDQGGNHEADKETRALIQNQAAHFSSILHAHTPTNSTLVSAAVTFLISSSPQSLMGSTKAHVRRDSPTRFYRYSSFRDPCDEEGWTDWVV